MTTIERLRALLDGLPPSWPVTRLGHAPHCGDGAEFPWDCTCDLPDFREDLEEAINALPALLDVVGDIEMTVGIYEELAAGIRASRDPRVMREREGAIASLGETLAAKVRAALARLEGRR